MRKGREANVRSRRFNHPLLASDSTLPSRVCELLLSPKPKGLREVDHDSLDGLHDLHPHVWNVGARSNKEPLITRNSLGGSVIFAIERCP
jgi:hypothetical protein